MLLHLIDGYEEEGRRWLPCSDCVNPRDVRYSGRNDIFSNSIVNAGLRGVRPP